MKINWKVRFKNKAWLLSFVMTIVAFIYQILGMFGIVPAVTEDQIMQLVAIAANIFVSLGVIIDPTTEGVSDSERAMGYDRLN